MKDNVVFKAALLYTTNRVQFQKKYGDNKLAVGLLDEMFLESESRPDLAERIALIAIGCIPSITKKGYDGMTSMGRPVEAKVRNYAGLMTAGRNRPYHSINDISQNIVNKYVEDNPLFVFPYFYDGHLAAAFSVDFLPTLHAWYQGVLDNHVTGRVSKTLGPSTWLENSTIAFQNKDKTVVEKLPTVLKTHVFKVNAAAKK